MGNGFVFRVVRTLFVTVMTCGMAMGARAADHVGQSVGAGARLFVTKTYPGHGRLSEKDFRQLADAGFTVVVNMWLEDVPGYCMGASKAGLAAMTWNLGMADAEKDDQVDRTVTYQGKTTRYTLPYSPAGWAKVTAQIAEQAKLSRTYTNFKGALLDFEIYDANSTEGFCETYDDATFAAFFREMGKPVPNPLPQADQRRDYLNKQQVLALYIESQARRVGEQARNLRRAIDAINPSFQIGVYGWGAFKETIMRNVATDRAPVLDLDATLYGRTIWSNAFEGGYDADEPDAKGLKWSLVTAAEMSRDARHRGYPAVLLSGHYPQSPGPKDGTQFRFTVRQSFNSAAYADGYWIWTDWTQPQPWADKQQWIDAMMVYWTQANAALDAGDWTWSSRQEDSVANPKATAPKFIMTTDGKTVLAWDPMTGKRIDTDKPLTWAAVNPSAGKAKSKLRIAGWSLRSIESTSVMPYEVGHGVRAMAMGDVDRQDGEELVTLNGGWIKIWDTTSMCQLLRFYVGAEQTDVRVEDSLK
ncbi:MAG: hypothetical protein IT447_02380 [Phycisphaerales bacterium]|nr:hypothetical protein [Phycisphaerales bacterium]